MCAFVGVAVVKNLTLAEDNSTHLILTWEEPFHSQDVISLYYYIFVVNLDTMDEQHGNTTTTSFQLDVANCGLYQLTITAHGVCGRNNCTYVAMAVTVDHNVTYDGGDNSMAI